MTSLPISVSKSISETASGGWSAKLTCSFEPGPERTIVRRTHSGPLYMQRPFYPEGPVAHVYLLHPPGGVVAGDSLNINVSSRDGGRGLVSTPGATKFYRSEGSIANVNQQLHVTDGSLEWFPAENIFFNGSKAKLRTDIRLSGNDALAWWEINCFGRQSAQESWSNGSMCSVANIYRDSKLMLRERLLVDEQLAIEMSCGMRNERVNGTMVLTPLESYSVDYARSCLASQVGFSSTYFDSMLVIRYLGDSAEDAKIGFASVWSGLRKALNATTPTLPRIWAT